MINAQTRIYDYFTLGDLDRYGQPQLSAEPTGQIKMAIYTTSQSIQDNINYQNATYLGLTRAPIDDKYVIQFGDKKLKVLYVTPGRIAQVYMAEI